MFLALVASTTAFGQNPEETIVTPTEILSDTLIRADTIPPIRNDSILISTDSLPPKRQDSIPATPTYRSDVETTIKYSARDYIIL